MFCAVFFWETTKSVMLCSCARQGSCNSPPKLIPQPYISPSFWWLCHLKPSDNKPSFSDLLLYFINRKEGGIIVTNSERFALGALTALEKGNSIGCLAWWMQIPSLPPYFSSSYQPLRAMGTDLIPGWWQDQQFGLPGIIQSGISASCSCGWWGWRLGEGWWLQPRGAELSSPICACGCVYTYRQPEQVCSCLGDQCQKCIL